MSASPRQNDWTPPPRPEWLTRVNEDGRGMDSHTLLPLQAPELIDTAMANTGLADFGQDEWREPLEVLVKAINEEAELNLFGRLMTRSDLLIWLQERLEIEETYRRHPQIEDEVVQAPVFIVGQPRSSTCSPSGTGWHHPSSPCTSWAPPFPTNARWP